jgi:hypothetical protein
MLSSAFTSGSPSKSNVAGKLVAPNRPVGTPICALPPPLRLSSPVPNSGRYIDRKLNSPRGTVPERSTVSVVFGSAYEKGRPV